MRKVFFTTILCVVLCFGLVGCGGDSVVDQVANSVQKNENVSAVKGGTNSNYPGITYEDAFDDFFGNPSWRYFKGTQEGPDDDEDGEPDYIKENIDIVEFTGKCTYQDVEVEALIQFTLDKENGTFEATYLSFNDVPQATFVLNSLLNKVFESYQESHNTTSESQVEESEAISIVYGSYECNSSDDVYCTADVGVATGNGEEYVNITCFNAGQELCSDCIILEKQEDGTYTGLGDYNNTSVIIKATAEGFDLQVVSSDDENCKNFEGSYTLVEALNMDEVG